MSQFVTPAPEPATELERYRILSSTAGVRVSPLVLGGMSLGDAWSSTMGSMDKEQSFKLLDAFRDAGGNFVDTAGNYQDGQSEAFIGEWMAERGNRDEMFVATKYTTQFRAWELGPGGKVANFAGNSKKSMFVAVENSLRKLRTSYIDLLYVHYWDYTTSIEEVMDSLHLLVEQGKVLYIGLSDAPAWVAAIANTYARFHGKTPFSVYQGRWNVMTRDFERDIIPVANHFGMALCPWDVLGSGKLQSRAQLAARQKAGEPLRSFFGPADQTPQQLEVSDALEAVGKEHGGASPQQVALAYVMAKARNVFPMVGGRKVEHLKDNIAALRIHLTGEQIKRLEAVTEFDIGFPQNVIGGSPWETGQESFVISATNHVAFPSPSRPVGHE